MSAVCADRGAFHGLHGGGEGLPRRQRAREEICEYWPSVVASVVSKRARARLSLDTIIILSYHWEVTYKTTL